MVDTPRIKMARILLRLLENPNGITFNELSDSYGIDDRTRRTYIADLKEIPEFLDEYGKSRVEVDGREDTRRVYFRPLNILKDDEAEKENIKKDLKIYCKQDTQSMVHVLECLKRELN